MLPRNGFYGTVWQGIPDGAAKELAAARQGIYEWCTSWRWPDHIRQLRALGVKRVFYQSIPQRIPAIPIEAQIPWNLAHYLSKLVNAKDWWLTTHSGRRVMWWGQYIVDWTRPEIAKEFARAYEQWRTTGGSNHNGLLFEVMASELYAPWFSPMPVPAAEWPSFRSYWRDTTFTFLTEMRRRFGSFANPQFPIIFGGDSHAPVEQFRPAGILMEDFLHRFAAPDPTSEDWREEFDGVPARRRGLVYAGKTLGNTLGTICKQQWHGDHVNPDVKFRETKLALATACLTDAMHCYVSYNLEELAQHPPVDLYIIPEMRMDLGTPLWMFIDEGDKVSREYEKCRVVVDIRTMTGHFYPLERGPDWNVKTVLPEEDKG